MSTTDTPDTVRSDLAAASGDPVLAHIDPQLIQRALTALSRAGGDLDRTCPVAGFPSLDTEGVEDRELRVEACLLADTLIHHDPASEPITVIARAEGAVDPWYDGIILAGDTPGHEGFITGVELVHAEDFTLAPAAPAGPVAALACATALLQAADRVRAVLGPACHLCGEPFQVDEHGIATHIDPHGQIDHDADEDHVPYEL